MTDVVDQVTRSRMMAGIKGRNTKPELLVRKELHKRGFRYRLHVKDLPGKPDIVLPKYNAVIFIHGCFWHGHNCHLYKPPKSRTEFWTEKIRCNKKRDQLNKKILLRKKWRMLTIWECSLKGKTKLDFDSLINKTEKWIKSESKCLEIKGT